MWLTLGKGGAAQQEYPALSMPFPSRMRMKAPLAHRWCDRKGRPAPIRIHVLLETCFHGAPVFLIRKDRDCFRTLVSHQKGMKMSGIVLSASVRQNLLSLQSTADLLSTTQNRLAAGNKGNSALDNPTNFFTAQGLNNRASDITNLLD